MGKNVLAFSFPIESNSIAEIKAEIEYPSKSVVIENDPYNFTINYSLKSFNPQVNFNLFRIIIPDNFYFQSIPNSEFLTNVTEHELVFKGLYFSENVSTPLNIRFSRTQTRFFTIVIWINRGLIFIVCIYLIINIFNLKYFQIRFTYNRIGKLLLSGVLLEVVKHFDELNLWNGFLYTETYLYILSVSLWYYSNHIISFIKKILRSGKMNFLKERIG